jgi:hypothetical protein
MAKANQPSTAATADDPLTVARKRLSDAVRKHVQACQDGDAAVRAARDKYEEAQRESAENRAATTTAKAAAEAEVARLEDEQRRKDAA